MAGEHDRLVKVDREREPIPANSLARKSVNCKNSSDINLAFS